MHTAAADPLIGRTLEGRYRVLEGIARGGMSTVYSAVDERLDRVVAVKVMSAALSADPAFTDRFSREARAAARLSNLNTVSVYDQGVDHAPGGVGGPPHVFLVMELVEGRTLRDLIRERGPLSVAQAVSIMEPVLSALAAAHRAGIVHRDVKPENILLSDDGVVKVADFGLARAIESEITATRTGLMMGTVAYCAPEQVSRGIADPRSDVYAAGIVLFELLTGSAPYQGDSAMSIAYQHVHNRVPAPSSRIAGIPEEIDELVVAATDSDPNGRPRDAGAFLAELADVRTALRLPVLAVPARPRNGVQQHRSVAYSGGGRAASSTTAVVREAGRHDTSVVPRRDGGRVGPPPPIVTPPPKRPPRPPRSAAAVRRRRVLVALIVVALVGLAAGYTGWWLSSGRFGRIPDVANASQNSAIQTLRSAGYKVSPSVETDYSETVPSGAVIATKPGGGSRKPHGTTVELIVSKGQERYTIPVTARTSLAATRAALAAIPVQVVADPQTQYNAQFPRGAVIGTDPPAGQKVKRGTSVTIILSLGPPMVAIPNIDPNTPADQAKQKLEQAGFQVKAVYAFNDSGIAKNNVVSVSPTGQQVQGGVVTLTVSKGPSTVVIPDIGSLAPVDQVKRQLEQLGLVVKVEKAFGGRAGAVVGIDPPSGTTVPVGSVVTLTVV